jgi:hypothetical protein
LTHVSFARQATPAVSDEYQCLLDSRLSAAAAAAGIAAADVAAAVPIATAAAAASRVASRLGGRVYSQSVACLRQRTICIMHRRMRPGAI